MVMASLVCMENQPQDWHGAVAPIIDGVGTLADLVLIQHLGSPDVRGQNLDAILEELLLRGPFRYPLEIKAAMQRRLIHQDITHVAYIAGYRGFCQATFPGDMKMDFSGEFKVQLEGRAVVNAWRTICNACPGKGRNFQNLCDHVATVCKNSHLYH